MRNLLLLLWCSPLWAGDASQLRDLAERHRFFELRRALDQPGLSSEDTAPYRGMAASRFGHEAEGVDMLRRFVATSSDSHLRQMAWEEIASASQRLGRYREAGDALDEELKVMPANDPDREETENTRALMESLKDIAPMTAEIGQEAPVRAVRNKIGSWNVPVTINGVSGDWIFDTGANFTALSESEAKRMGLTIRRSKAWGAGSTGARNDLAVAVAGDMTFDGAHLHNVVVLVLTDQSMNIEAVHYRITGALGLPVMRALGRVGITGDGQVRIGPPAPAAAGAPNLYFEELSPLFEIEHQGHFLQMHLDTGANDTTLNPSFRGALSATEAAHIRKKNETTAGAGGAVKRKSEFVPEVRMDVGGKAVTLKKLSLRSAPPEGKLGYGDGVIGMDALWSGFLLDFDTMRLDIDAAQPPHRK